MLKKKRSLLRAVKKKRSKIKIPAMGQDTDTDLPWNTSGNDNNFNILKSLVELVSSITFYLHVTKPNLV